MFCRLVNQLSIVHTTCYSSPSELCSIIHLLEGLVHILAFVDQFVLPLSREEQASIYVPHLEEGLGCCVGHDVLVGLGGILLESPQALPQFPIQLIRHRQIIGILFHLWTVLGIGVSGICRLPEYPF